ncbi:MAG: lipoyl domain-containing protein [Burkholderiaceae bacterium]|nr:lipoyl domain-containing protein [Burkholderiaceae bacterium]
MRITLKMPMFGMNMDEATVVAWHRAPGESFRKGESLYQVETEKVTTEVEAPCDGTLLEVLVPIGYSAAARAPVCVIDALQPA